MTRTFVLASISLPPIKFPAGDLPTIGFHAFSVPSFCIPPFSSAAIRCPSNCGPALGDSATGLHSFEILAICSPHPEDEDARRDKQDAARH